MLKNIRLLLITSLIISVSSFGVYAEDQAAADTDTAVTSAADEVSAEIETEDAEPAAEEAEQTKPEKAAKEADEADKAAKKAEREQRKQEKLDRYQAQLFKRLEMSIDGYNAAAAIPVIDMYRHRMLGGGAACIVTGSIMFVLSPVMMSVGGVFAFDKEYGGSVIKFEGNSINFIDEKKDMLAYFIPGTIVFGMGAAFGIMSLIITPMCAVYFSKAHKSKLVLRRLKGLAMLQGIGVDYINDDGCEKVGLSYGIRI